MKKRADVILFERGLVDSREKGKRLIMEGVVYSGLEKVFKPGDKLDEDVELTIKENPNIYVSRGGLKLEKAMDTFNLSLEEIIAMDIGASTGGFTDCMLKNGAKKVYAVDVGYGQLDWKLRNDERVVVMERTNIRGVTLEDLGEPMDFISIDVSFISLKLVLPVAESILTKGGEIVALVKPQFEAGRDKVGKKGIIRDRDIHYEVLKETIEFSQDLGLGALGLTYSPITGAKGNIEFLLYLKKGEAGIIDEESINKIINEGHLTLN